MAREPTGERKLSAADSRELLKRLQAGDARAGDRLFARYLPQLQRWAHRRMPQWARGMLDTGDLVQDAVMNTLKNVAGFKPQRDGALLGYLRRTLVNRMRDQLRYAARHPGEVPLDEHVRDSTESPLELAAKQETRERYLVALKRLREADRHAIAARLEMGYSYEQLALVLGKSTPEAARLAVRRALLRLAREMQRG